ncbi:hypothetical protein BDY21DRAFT_362135 [Lineolata rhizophorae]|uniref:Cytochrome c oxidase assembly protein COX20, mitochondrial n=1 Tax=Lineolata rhizophorae TaxID=578093 RepID=A0A6A6P6G2_9PEZI|nr:hypothetical protein BDY21DRAFT_362135 [Lineolata rhizophorae]
MSTDAEKGYKPPTSADYTPPASTIDTTKKRWHPKEDLPAPYQQAPSPQPRGVPAPPNISVPTTASSSPSPSSPPRPPPSSLNDVDLHDPAANPHSLNTAGAPAQREARAPDVGVWAVVRRLSWEDFKNVGRLPCARDAFLTGIGGAFAAGGAALVLKKPLWNSCNWAVGTYAVTAMSSYQYCAVQRQREKAGVKHVVEIMRQKEGSKARAEAARKKADEEAAAVAREADEARRRREEEERAAARRAWWKVW